MLTYRSHCAMKAVTLIFWIWFRFWWLSSTSPKVCACSRVAWSIYVPDACVSSVTSYEVKIVPLSMIFSLGTLRFCVKISSSAWTTEVVSGLRSGTANWYRENKSQAVNTKLYQLELGNAPTGSISMMSPGPLHGSYNHSRVRRMQLFLQGIVLLHIRQLAMYEWNLGDKLGAFRQFCYLFDNPQGQCMVLACSVLNMSSIVLSNTTICLVVTLPVGSKYSGRGRCGWLWVSYGSWKVFEKIFFQN